MSNKNLFLEEHTYYIIYSFSAILDLFSILVLNQLLIKSYINVANSFFM